MISVGLASLFAFIMLVSFEQLSLGVLMTLVGIALSFATYSTII